jgi:hypothetical protein
MGEVYRAHDTRLERDIALKILPRRLSSDPSSLARFEREARQVAALNRPKYRRDLRCRTLALASSPAPDEIEPESVVHESSGAGSNLRRPMPPQPRARPHRHAGVGASIPPPVAAEPGNTGVGVRDDHDSHVPPLVERSQGPDPSSSSVEKLYTGRGKPCDALPWRLGRLSFVASCLNHCACSSEVALGRSTVGSPTVECGPPVGGDGNFRLAGQAARTTRISDSSERGALSRPSTHFIRSGLRPVAGLAMSTSTSHRFEGGLP